MKKLPILACIGIIWVSIAPQVSAQDDFEFRTVAENLRVPWEILWGPDDHIWMTERFGRISRVDPETGEATELVVIDDVAQQTESGLLGLVLHPDFAAHPFIYTAYTYLDGFDLLEKIVQYTFENGRLVDPVILLDNIPGNRTHVGCRLIIDDDLKLYATTGDAQDRPSSQNVERLSGKTLRMNLDGSIPDDNPFEGSYTWTFGHRNAQGLVLAPNGIMYSSEHGPSSDDELNIIERSRNYGWPNVEGDCDIFEQAFCDEHNVKEPVHTPWTPTLAVAGIDYYGHTRIEEWNHSILMVTLKERDLRQLKLSEDGLRVEEERIFFNRQFGRLRDLCISPDGRVFIATSNRDGRNEFPEPNDDRIIEISRSGGNTGIAENLEFVGLRISPNPVSSLATIHIPASLQGGTIELVTLLGRVVMHDRLPQGVDRYRVQLKSLPSGTYVARVRNEGRIEFAAIIAQ